MILSYQACQYSNLDTLTSKIGLLYQILEIGGNKCEEQEEEQEEQEDPIIIEEDKNKRMPIFVIPLVLLLMKAASILISTHCDMVIAAH